MSEKKFTHKADQFYQQSVMENKDEHQGAAIAATLTDANFADGIAQKIWSKLPEQDRNCALADFRCSTCLIWDVLGIPPDELEKMTEKQLRETMEKAVRLQHEEGSTRASNNAGVVQLENIMIHFDEADLYEDQGEKLQITGDCERCGSSITRTLQGPLSNMLNAMGELMKEAKESQPAKAGRNDPCPCGSGLKYKKCCGKNA